MKRPLEAQASPPVLEPGDTGRPGFDPGQAKPYLTPDGNAPSRLEAASARHDVGQCHGFVRRLLLAEGRSTFALDGADPVVRRLNATMAEALAGEPPRWFECVSNALEQSGMEGEYSEELTPVMISQRWLSVSDRQGGYCGGAHPDASSSYRLYDMTNGAEADLHDWFSDRGFSRERPEGAGGDIVTLTPALRNEIIGAWRPQQEECGPVIREAEYWTVGLTRDGMTFGPSLPHVVAACEEGWVLGFDRLRPYLTPEALANIRALQAERPRAS